MLVLKFGTSGSEVDVKDDSLGTRKSTAKSWGWE